MVKLELDTNKDPLSELEEALKILQDAIARRTQEAPVEEAPSAKQLVEESGTEETAFDAGFLKITVKDTDASAPTVNELLEQEAMTEDELQELYKHVPEAQEVVDKKQEPVDDDDEGAYIEIVEFEDDDD